MCSELITKNVNEIRELQKALGVVLMSMEDLPSPQKLVPTVVFFHNSISKQIENMTTNLAAYENAQK